MTASALVACLGLAACGSETKAPDVAARDFWVAVGSKDLSVVYTDLPASYRADVDGALKDLAAAVDPEVYDDTMAVANKAVALMKTKEDVVQPMVEKMMSKELGMAAFMVNPIIKSQWQPICGLLETVVSSDVKTHAGLSNLDVPSFLKGMGGDLLTGFEKIAGGLPEAMRQGQPTEMAVYKEAKIELVEQKEATATIRITLPDQEPMDEQMVLVEGRWVPASIADGWDNNMKQLRSGIADIKEQMGAMDKAQTRSMMEGVSGAIDKAMQAKNEEELMAAIGPLLGG